jgi:hypothetical protein
MTNAINPRPTEITVGGRTFKIENIKCSKKVSEEKIKEHITKLLESNLISISDDKSIIKFKKNNKDISCTVNNQDILTPEQKKQIKTITRQFVRSLKNDELSSFSLPDIKPNDKTKPIAALLWMLWDNVDLLEKAKKTLEFKNFKDEQGCLDLYIKPYLETIIKFIEENKDKEEIASLDTLLEKLEKPSSKLYPNNLVELIEIVFKLAINDTEVVNLKDNQDLTQITKTIKDIETNPPKWILFKNVTQKDRPQNVDVSNLRYRLVKELINVEQTIPNWHIHDAKTHQFYGNSQGKQTYINRDNHRVNLAVYELQSDPLISSSNEEKIKNSTDLSIQKIAKRSIYKDILVGVYNSKIFRAIALTSIGLLYAFLCTNPVGWTVAALHVSIIAAKVLIAASSLLAFLLFIAIQSGHEKSLLSELSAIGRLFKTNNHNLIQIDGWKNRPASKLYLGALPNRLFGKFEESEKKLENGALLSINEDWELQPHGLSIPYTKEDWKRLNIQNHVIDAIDHELLPISDMEKAADIINETLSKNQNVYVHCRAGKGRSAMAIAAYLIKYAKDQNDAPLSLEMIIDGIQNSRKGSTIAKKRIRLEEFKNYIEQKS